MEEVVEKLENIVLDLNHCININYDSCESLKVFDDRDIFELIDIRNKIKIIKFKTIDKKIDNDREVIIQAFLSGKKFSDGEQFAPNASLDIANKWYDENFK